MSNHAQAVTEAVAHGPADSRIIVPTLSDFFGIPAPGLLGKN